MVAAVKGRQSYSRRKKRGGDDGVSSQRGAERKTTRKVPVVSEISAGGVVVRQIRGRLHIALLRTEHSRGKVWVLPKGHIEQRQGETREEAAVRETKEELGIEDVRLKCALGSTRFHFYTRRGRVVKTVHYYLMEGLTEAMHPQAEEGLLEARWVPIREALKIITYPTDKKIILRAIASSRRGKETS